MKTLNVGDIVVVNLDPTIGDEKKKTCMCMVIENGGTPLDLLIVLPITEYHQERNKYFFVPIPNFNDVGLTKPSAIDCYQIRTLSVKRLKHNQNGEIKVVGTLGKTVIDQVLTRLALILDIRQEHIVF